MILGTLGSLLHRCSKIKAYRQGLSLHAVVIKNGFLSDVLLCNHILNMYAKCGHICFAQDMFDGMCDRNLVSWSAMISGYDQAGKHLVALDLFSRIPLEPNEYIFASALSACASLLALRPGRQIHAKAMKIGCSSISFVSNALISMYMKCGQCSDALSVFADTTEVNSVSYNSLITGLVENQQCEKALELFKVMNQRGLIPDCFTFAGVLGGCTSVDDLSRGIELHCQTIKLNLDSTPFVGNVLVTMYSKFNLMEEAERVFKFIQEKDVISWNTLIAACSHCDYHSKGINIFSEMTKEVNLKPDDFTYASVLAACAGLASIQLGKQIHARLIRTKPDEDVGVGNALINMYAKCGCIEYSYTLFNMMDCHNVVTWNSIIAGFGNNGFGAKAVELFEQMKEMGANPDSLTFIAVLTACNHAGLVDKGQDYFNSMDKLYGITPDIEHFSCLIDLLGRAGRLNEAVEYMEKSPYGSDPVVLGCLLSACRLHGDIVIGEYLAEKILKLQPATSSPYVLLSNLYALDGMWNSVADARKMLKTSGLKKEPGHSLVEVKGIVEKFTIGDFSHSQIEEILDILKNLNCFREESVLCN